MRNIALEYFAYTVIADMIVKKDLLGCGYCEANFEEDDFAYVLETGLCPYCHKELERVLTE